MGFRGAEETLRARILELEEENARLRAEVERLGGKKPISQPPPAPVPGASPIWSPGDSWLMGWDPTRQLLAYTGERINDQQLRFFSVAEKSQASFELAENGAKHTARLDMHILAPLNDGSLAFFSWPAGEIVQRIRLNAPLVAQPIQNQRGEILAVTASRDLLVIDPQQLVVTSRRQVDVDSLEKIGFPNGDARQRHNGYEIEASLASGWTVSAYRDQGELRLCALARNFAGNEEMGACVLPQRGKRPIWVREAGGGSFIYLYGLDGMLVIHNVSLEIPSKTWAFWQQSGEPVLTIAGRKPDAVLEIHDTDGSVLSRTTV